MLQRGSFTTGQNAPMTSEEFFRKNNYRVVIPKVKCCSNCAYGAPQPANYWWCWNPKRAGGSAIGGGVQVTYAKCVCDGWKRSEKDLESLPDENSTEDSVAKVVFLDPGSHR